MRLLYINAENTNINEPDKVGKSKKDQSDSDKKTMTGFEPAGGCTVRVSIMMAMAVPTANATDHQCGPVIFMNSSPINELMKWPRMTFLGCENGASG
jgi:hypothetical protein